MGIRWHILDGYRTGQAMKKILVIITTNFVSWGGLTTVFMNYYRVMDKNDLCIDVASMNKAEQLLEKEITDNGGQYIQLPDKRKHAFKYLLSLNRLLMREKYDVIHVHGNSATMVGELLLAKKNRVNNRIAHSHNTKGAHPVMQKLLKSIFNSSYTTAIACSGAAGSWLYSHEFRVLNNVIDTKRYHFSRNNREEVRNKLKIGPDTVVLGHVGKFVSAKNHTFILDIFREFLKRNPNSKLLLIGDGNLRNEIENEIAEFNLSDTVILVGMINDTQNYYSAMDIFILPSKHEGLSLALLEAQANGLTCIVSNNVTKENNITGNVQYLDLDKRIWVDNLCHITPIFNDRDSMSTKAVNILREKGYDNVTNGELLRELYVH